MTEMVERVARAIFEDAEAQMVAEKHLDKPRDWDRIFPWFRNSHIQYARAAIAAMREPTEAMQTVGAAGLGVSDEGDICFNARQAWQDMIDVALK